MVMALEIDGQMRHLHRDSRIKRLEWLHKSGTPDEVPYPEADLNQFEYLVKAVCSLLPAEGVPPELQDGLESLRRFRDSWTHFGDYSWSLPVSEARRVVSAGVKLTALLLPPAQAEGLFDNLTDRARYEVAVTALEKLLVAAELDELD
jgi:hypothetical protein